MAAQVIQFKRREQPPARRVLEYLRHHPNSRWERIADALDLMGCQVGGVLGGLSRRGLISKRRMQGVSRWSIARPERPSGDSVTSLLDSAERIMRALLRGNTALAARGASWWLRERSKLGACPSGNAGGRA